MPSPPINTSGRSLAPIRLHAKAASAFSDPVLRHEESLPNSPRPSLRHSRAAELVSLRDPSRCAEYLREDGRGWQDTGAAT